MKKIFYKLFKWYYKIIGYVMLLPNFILYKYYNPKTLIVLGMHRSGTSCMTRIFNLCNVNLGKILMEAQIDNPKGFWENSLVFEINEKILKQSGGTWSNPPSSDELKVTFFDKLAMLAILYSCPNSVLGIKDPRMLITWHAWKPLIKNYCIVGIFRHPLSVANSLNKRNSLPNKDGLNLWKKYNQILLSISKEENVTLIDFDNPDIFKDRICSILEKLNLSFNENSLKFYNPKNRYSDNLDKIENEEIHKMYEFFKIQALEI